MGSGIMLYWANGKICVDDKIKMANILLKTNLPVFHYSIIPFLRQAFKPQKVLFFQTIAEFPRRFSYLNG